MVVAFMLIGIVVGLVASVAVWAVGGGLGLAVLAYMGGGTLGTIFAAGLTLVTRRTALSHSAIRQPHS